jgi:phosphoglycolate phosphatase
LLIQALAQSAKSDAAEVRASARLALLAADFDKRYQARCGTRSQLYPQVRQTCWPCASAV